MIIEILGLVCVMLFFFSIMTAEDSNNIRIINFNGKDWQPFGVEEK